MYGDTEVIRGLARQMSDQGDQVRALAERLASQSEAVAWRGQAAEAMRERMAERVARLRSAADRHDDAATALRTHAATVEERKRLISQIAERAAEWIDDARLVAPPPGHRDWLRFADRMPGAGR